MSLPHRPAPRSAGRQQLTAAKQVSQLERGQAKHGVGVCVERAWDRSQGCLPTATFCVMRAKVPGPLKGSEPSGRWWSPLELPVLPALTLNFSSASPQAESKTTAVRSSVRTRTSAPASCPSRRLGRCRRRGKGGRSHGERPQECQEAGTRRGASGHGSGWKRWPAALSLGWHGGWPLLPWAAPCSVLEAPTVHEGRSSLPKR